MIDTQIVNGTELAVRIVGDVGDWLALTPGGRRSHNEILPLAERIASAGYRVLLHDRRNTGASEFRLSDTPDEESIWADDLAQLLDMVGAESAYIGGFSSGSRMSMRLAARYPEKVRALMLCRVTGGETALRRLPDRYYGEFIAAAQSAGMEGVLETDHFRNSIAINPRNRERLLAIDPVDYIAIMSRWRDAFVAGGRYPVMGMPAEELASIRAPTLVIPGNDRTHSRESGHAAFGAIVGAELFELPVAQTDRDIIPFPEWKSHEPAIAEAFVRFMRRH